MLTPGLDPGPLTLRAFLSQISPPAGLAQATSSLFCVAVYSTRAAGETGRKVVGNRLTTTEAREPSKPSRVRSNKTKFSRVVAN